jgi:hypothetical protein
VDGKIIQSRDKEWSKWCDRFIRIDREVWQGKDAW